MLIVKGLLFASVLGLAESWCTPFTFGDWHEWESCSSSCGGGTHRRVRYSCVKSNTDWQTENCNEICYNGGSYINGYCHCTRWQFGRCCEECPEIAQCIDRHCTNQYNTTCERCQSNGLLFTPTPGKTHCERMCAWDKLNCWPGACGDGLVRRCSCASGFHKFDGPGETSCQLDASNTPTVNKCSTTVYGPEGETKQTKESACENVRDFYGNFQPYRLKFDMAADFEINITNVAKPAFINETEFGVTDVTVYLIRELMTCKRITINMIHLLQDDSSSLNANETYSNKTVLQLNNDSLLNNGEKFCVRYEVKGGGYVRTIELLGSHSERGPYPYRKTNVHETVCYRYDNACPKHCLETRKCTVNISEPLHISNRIVRIRNINASFNGWFDPVPNGGKHEHASGIESYQITVKEVQNGLVDTEIKRSIVMNASKTSTTLTLPTESPRLYCITLEVKDVADNVQQTRRFVLFDNTSYITTNNITGSFDITSASTITGHKWQTHHGDLCLNWESYFTNKEYEMKSLLGPIKRNYFISGIYEQTEGPLPAVGTVNIFGIIGYWFSWSLNNGQVSEERSVPDFPNQTFCQNFSLKDGQTYTLNIRAVDIVNNTLSENRTVHIDGSVPNINNIGLRKNGITHRFVHDELDLSKIELYFEALDLHSGLLNIDWKLGTPDSGSDLGSGIINVNKMNCSKGMSNCYCPSVGGCEAYNYSISMNKLVQTNTHIGNHNRVYIFTIKVTNNALLSNKEHLYILADEIGAVYEENNTKITEENETHVITFATEKAEMSKGETNVALIVGSLSAALVVIGCVVIIIKRRFLYKKYSNKNAGTIHGLQNNSLETAEHEPSDHYETLQKCDRSKRAENYEMLRIHGGVQPVDASPLPLFVMKGATNDDRIYDNLKLGGNKYTT